MPPVRLSTNSMASSDTPNCSLASTSRNAGIVVQHMHRYRGKAGGVGWQSRLKFIGHQCQGRQHFTGFQLFNGYGTTEADLGSMRNHVRNCRLQFDGVGKTRAGYCFRAGKHTASQTQTATPVSLRSRIGCAAAATWFVWAAGGRAGMPGLRLSAKNHS